jgi:hypothetical protein
MTTTTTTDRFTTADLDRFDLPEGWRAELQNEDVLTSDLFVGLAVHVSALWP